MTLSPVLLQQSLLTVPGPGPELAFRRPPLDWSAPPPFWNSRPRSFQVMNEGEQYWHGSAEEYQANYYHDCGPIAVAHAVNFTNGALGRSDTVNASDAIRETIADGGYAWGDQTLRVDLLGRTIARLAGVQVQYSRDSLDWRTAVSLAQTRWILVNTPGHISLVVADRRGRELLELVQYHVNRSGPLDAGDLIISADEWEAWNWQTVHPLRKLWLAPNEQDPPPTGNRLWGGPTPASAAEREQPAPEDLPQLDSSTPARFVETATPYARMIERTRGFPAAVLVAMACNETGYGNPRYTIEYNFFGIKRSSAWSGRFTQSRTWEVIGGQRIEIWAEFRAYDTPAASFADFCDFLEQNGRYRGIDPNSGRYRPDWDAVRLRENPERLPYREWCERLLSRILAAGYATDPAYVNKILGIIDQWSLAS